MLHLSKNDKNKVLDTIKSGNINAADATDGELLSELGWNMWDSDRNLIKKYDSNQNNEFIDSYNDYVQNVVISSPNISPSIHILDCTKTTVNLDNSNYENSEVIKDN